MFVSSEDLLKPGVCVCVCEREREEPRCLYLLRKIEMCAVCEEFMSTDLRDSVTLEAFNLRSGSA